MRGRRRDRFCELLETGSQSSEIGGTKSWKEHLLRRLIPRLSCLRSLHARVDCEVGR